MTLSQVFYFVGPEGSEAFLRMPDGTCHLMPAIAEFKACPFVPSVAKEVAKPSAPTAVPAASAVSAAQASPDSGQSQPSCMEDSGFEAVVVDRASKRLRHACQTRAPATTDRPQASLPNMAVPREDKNERKRSPPRWISRLPVSSSCTPGDAAPSVQRDDSDTPCRPRTSSAAAAEAMHASNRCNTAEYDAAYWSTIATQPLSQDPDADWNVTTQEWKRIEDMFDAESLSRGA